MFPKTIEYVHVPPLKSQGIKTKLVNFIAQNITWDESGRWIEPFFGSGVVMFNFAPQRAVASDSNMHIINFYKGIQDGSITAESTRHFLEKEGEMLLKEGESHYYQVRERFNKQGNPIDFLFLNRSCFNGIVRFNSKGQYNVPFCRKTNRFSQPYITKIVNQVKWVQTIMRGKEWNFSYSNWRETLEQCKVNDFVYLDPPYYGRHTDYYNRWDEKEMHDLTMKLKELKCGFALSLWFQNKYRTNEVVKEYFSEFTIKTISHFYHVGPTEDLRNAMIEALIIKPSSKVLLPQVKDKNAF